MSTLEEIVALANLEERIQRAIQLVAKLRKEKEAAEAAAAEARADSARSAEELKSLHSERKQVRSRIEKLLGQIDQLSAS
jgi:FtsZ-binding cell division protein ZapB